MPLPSSHAARLKLARSLAATLAEYPSSGTPYFPEIRDNERQLLKLGDDAFDALLPFLESSASTVSDSLFAVGDDSVFGHIYALISQVMRSDSQTQAEAILRIARKYAHLPDYYGVYSPLICLLADHGHSNLVVKSLIARVSRIKPGTGIQWLPPELECLCSSNSPLAVEYLIAALNNPATPAEVRAAAYCGLARSGTDAGIAAVLAVRNQPLTPLPSFRTMMDLDHLSTDVKVDHGYRSKLLAIRTDDSGELWGLLTSGIIGSFGDLWIVAQKGDRWGDPIFTGVDTTHDHAFFPETDVKPFSIDGMTLEQLVDSGAWIAKFVHNPDLRKDTDGDGWSDLVEQRLGTDPKRASTDGSGIPDSLNRNPLGSRLPKGDAEEIMAAAFDVRTRFRYEEAAAPFAVTFPAGTRPFRLTGYPLFSSGSRKTGSQKVTRRSFTAKWSALQVSVGHRTIPILAVVGAPEARGIKGPGTPR